MKNFDWTTFTKRIAVEAPITTIYNSWSKASEMERWFLREAVFYDQNKKPVDKTVNIQKGFSYQWTWHLYEGAMPGEIKEVNSKDWIQFTFEGHCIVDVKLKEQDPYTVIELTHSNIPTDDESKQHIRLGCASGWAFYLVNLKSIYEGGIDLRNKDTNLKPMINN